MSHISSGLLSVSYCSLSFYLPASDIRLSPSKFELDPHNQFLLALNRNGHNGNALGYGTDVLQSSS